MCWFYYNENKINLSGTLSFFILRIVTCTMFSIPVASVRPLCSGNSNVCYVFQARARIQLLENHLPQVDDVVNGGRHVFSTILKAVINRNVDSLAPLVLGNGVIDAHRKGSWKLTEKQRQSLQVTEDDFIGFNGIVYNWNGFQTATSNLSRMIHDTWMVHKDALGKSLENPYFKYSIILGAILRKNELYDMVRSLPYNPSSERMVLRMPAGYGYVTPRHIIMKIDLCHEVTQEYPVELCEDAMIYDFHIHSF
uniref:Hexosyltransferase n=1 Tax=Heterorhabditis bacteriophora TaxID=37862 RepID=A0A1I7XJ56_HETBA